VLHPTRPVEPLKRAVPADLQPFHSRHQAEARISSPVLASRLTYVFRGAAAALFLFLLASSLEFSTLALFAKSDEAAGGRGTVQASANVVNTSAARIAYDTLRQIQRALIEMPELDSREGFEEFDALMKTLMGEQSVIGGAVRYELIPAKADDPVILHIEWISN